MQKDGLSRTLQLPHSFLIWGSNLGARSAVCLQYRSDVGVALGAASLRKTLRVA